ncbi:MAG TPA: phage tail sheath subtilisin-like domain-containing protein [Actinomycetota bacterium]|nr:phage tail sheath subtilisin-like domain-containing protein [Actinomycetota bacterium]
MPTYLSPGVYVEELEAGSRPIEGVGTAVAAFIGLAEAGPFNTPKLVTNWNQFTKDFGEFVEGAYLAHAVYGYFLNGGGACYVVRVGGNGALPTARGELPSAQDDKQPALRFAALEPGEGGNAISVEIAPPTDEAPESFNVVVKKGPDVAETFENVTTKKGKTNVVMAVQEKSKLITVEEVATGAALAVPTNVSVPLTGGSAPAVPEVIAPGDYVGDSADRTGFAGLEAVDEVTMLCVPDLMSAHQKGLIDAEGVKAVQLATIAHCELMGDRVAIIDPPPGLNAQQIKEWRVDYAGYDSKYATLYWPWIKVADPATGTNVFTPPSGYIAGVWGRNDDTRGVHKAPANEVIRGAIDIELNITKNEHDQLNPHGINCIRSFPGRGIRIWGARTISSDPSWKYVNVRRLFNYLEESILAGTQWAVFEPNDAALWAKMRRTISSFLTNEWRKGALFGLTPDQSFFVKCDSETNPPEIVDVGQVVCEIGVAPVKPAEFVVFRLAQFSGGASVSE